MPSNPVVQNSLEGSRTQPAAEQSAATSNEEKDWRVVEQGRRRPSRRKNNPSAAPTNSLKGKEILNNAGNGFELLSATSDEGDALFEAAGPSFKMGESCMDQVALNSQADVNAQQVVGDLTSAADKMESQAPHAPNSNASMDAAQLSAGHLVEKRSEHSILHLLVENAEEAPVANAVRGEPPAQSSVKTSLDGDTLPLQRQVEAALDGPVSCKRAGSLDREASSLGVNPLMNSAHDPAIDSMVTVGETSVLRVGPADAFSSEPLVIMPVPDCIAGTELCYEAEALQEAVPCGPLVDAPPTKLALAGEFSKPVSSTGPSSSSSPPLGDLGLKWALGKTSCGGKTPPAKSLPVGGLRRGFLESSQKSRTSSPRNAIQPNSVGEHEKGV